MSPDESDRIVPATPEQIARAVDLLEQGEVIGLPTETVYGLAADAGSAAGVARIYEVKGRPADHPLIVHVLDDPQAAWWGMLGAAGEALAKAFWPGPLTLIVERQPGAPGWACAGQSSVGLRCPAHPVARRVLAELTRRGRHGLAAPSANRFGRVSPTRAEHVLADLGDAVPLVIEGGPCDVGLESTIVDLTRGGAEILRPGAITAEQIHDVLGAMAGHGQRGAQAPRASGTLAAHYAPRTPVCLVEPGELQAGLSDALRMGQRVAAWVPESVNLPSAVVRVVACTDARAFARDLYQTLRSLDGLGVERVFVQDLPVGPSWDAARDRLRRAAASFAPPCAG